MSLSIQFTAALKRRIEANLVIAGEVVATEVRRNIQTSPRGGRTYVKTHPNRTKSIFSRRTTSTACINVS